MKFKSESGAVKAKEANGTEFMGRTLIIRLSSDPIPEAGERKSGPGPQRTGGDGKTVFVGNLSYQSTQDSVKEFFENCGKVLNVRIATEAGGKPRGFAHVEFESEEAVDKAMKLSGDKLDGREIRVDHAGSKGGSGGSSRSSYGGHHDSGRDGGRDSRRDSRRDSGRDFGRDSHHDSHDSEHRRHKHD